MHLAGTWRATRRGAVRAGSGFPVGHSTGGCPCAYARFISGGLHLLAGAGFCPPESEPHQSGWDWLCGLCPLSQRGDSCAGLRQILGAALPAARARRCSPGPGRLQLHVVRRRGQAVAVLLMSVLGRSGRRKESGLRPWLAAEPRVVATRSCRCCSGNRRRVHSRPAWNCSCWGRCGAWALKQSGSSRRVSLRPAGMRRRFGLPGLPGVLRSMSLRFPSVGGGRAEMRQWARIRSRGPPAEGVGSSVR